jgi:hypothetical protein
LRVQSPQRQLHSTFFTSTLSISPRQFTSPSCATSPRCGTMWRHKSWCEVGCTAYEVYSYLISEP